MPVAGAAIAAVGSIGGAVLSSNASSKATRTAANAQNAQLDFDRERYDDWQNIFGGLQENLSSYYNSINPDMYAAAGLEAFEEERSNQMAQLDRSLAQRGLAESGLAATIKTEDAINSAEARAGIRRDAQAKVRDEQTRFLQIGMGQNPGNSVSSTLGSIAQNAQVQAQQASQAAGQAMGSAISTTGKAVVQGYEAWSKANEGSTT